MPSVEPKDNASWNMLLRWMTSLNFFARDEYFSLLFGLKYVVTAIVTIAYRVS